MRFEGLASLERDAEHLSEQALGIGGLDPAGKEPMDAGGVAVGDHGERGRVGHRRLDRVRIRQGHQMTVARWISTGSRTAADERTTGTQKDRYGRPARI